MHRATFVRLASFVLVIAGSFGTAYGIGSKLPGNPESRPHTHNAPEADPVPSGFSVDGYVLVTEATPPSPGSLALHVNAPDGERVAKFTEAHGARLHVVLIRPDLSGFRHLHPDIGADGTFVVPIDEPGKWHIVVDGKPAGAADSIVLATNVDDEVPVEPVTLPTAEDEITVDDLTIVHDGVNFTVTSKDGSPADGLEPFLGQSSHLIAIRQGDLAYLHLHPVESATATFSFDGVLPAGTYRLFLQFGHGGDVVTAGFTVVQP